MSVGMHAYMHARSEAQVGYVDARIHAQTCQLAIGCSTNLRTAPMISVAESLPGHLHVARCPV